MNEKLFGKCYDVQWHLRIKKICHTHSQHNANIKRLICFMRTCNARWMRRSKKKKHFCCLNVCRHADFLLASVHTYISVNFGNFALTCAWNENRLASNGGWRGNQIGNNTHAHKFTSQFIFFCFFGFLRNKSNEVFLSKCHAHNHMSSYVIFFFFAFFFLSIAWRLFVLWNFLNKHIVLAYPRIYWLRVLFFAAVEYSGLFFSFVCFESQIFKKQTQIAENKNVFCLSNQRNFFWWFFFSFCCRKKKYLNLIHIQATVPSRKKKINKVNFEQCTWWWHSKTKEFSILLEAILIEMPFTYTQRKLFCGSISSLFFLNGIFDSLVPWWIDFFLLFVAYLKTILKVISRNSFWFSISLRLFFHGCRLSLTNIKH